MLKRVPLEAITWTAGLVMLACLNSGNNHFTLCPLKNAGFDWCPGCGLGQSISLLFQGDFRLSFQTHPLGFFAVIVLSFRIIKLTKSYLQNYGKSYRRYT